MTNVTTQSVFGTQYGGTAPEIYERYFVPLIPRPFASDLVAEAALAPGEHVLDVACGTGIVARLAFERVKPTGTVVGVDLNPGMLSVARAAAVASGADIRWYETSAESIPLPDDSFDAVLCQLGLQFMTDKSAALREMRRTLAPGGRVLVSTPPPNPFFDVLDKALAHHISDEAAAFMRMVFTLNDPAAIQELFQSAGFREVSVRRTSKSVRLPAARNFLWQYVNCSPLSGLLSGVDPIRIRALEDEVIRGWREWSDGDGMRYEQGMILSSARK
jgi:ubiquinone/menaquinone biosynthesis C-methylase UbiE